VVRVKLDKDAVDPDDVEMLEDLIMAATNEALRKMEDCLNSRCQNYRRNGGGFPF
jgi:DNA-binding protein YbaB